ncbi:MAG: SAM-dependent methyltransferase [Bacteroidetes bacterium HGW-Bacteroidetes-7]|jgi:ubiquinone/menaquinone biosynthesis C-methylase UbiE|nr:MAG: SAM-dependent methyltransferase [Bacteroidetes bacterium HGW-Bacteroidetes-7]
MNIRRKPFDKDNLKIKKGYNVLEVGPGSNPTKRADVLLEKFIDNNQHRRGDLKIFPHQRLVEGDAEEMPFKDKEFDYSICCHVLEHAEDPAIFLNELMRVSKGGYIETPSLIGEFLAPKKSHKWLLLEINQKLVLYEKSKVWEEQSFNYGDFFLNHMPYNSLLYRLLDMTQDNFMVVRYLWKDNIEYLVNPEGEYRDYFSNVWTPNIVSKLYPKISISRQVALFLQGLGYFAKKKFIDKLTKRYKAMSIEDYRQLKKHD